MFFSDSGLLSVLEVSMQILVPCWYIKLTQAAIDVRNIRKSHPEAPLPY
ncbi:hypothetical protein [Methanosarcina barkeri]|nr:hypothetical protein [Methanosarcina barkeri]